MIVKLPIFIMEIHIFKKKQKKKLKKERPFFFFLFGKYYKTLFLMPYV